MFLLLLLLQFGSASASSMLKSEGPPVFFLKDATDDSCLAGQSFKRCGLDTLWYVSGKKAGAYQLHRRPLGDDEGDSGYSETDYEDKCLLK